MTKLRNIGYLRFGSKIRQGFAVTTPSLTPPLSLPLYGCRGKQMRGKRGEKPFIQCGGACRGRQAPCHPAGGRQAPANGLRANKNYFYLHISPCRAAGPLPGGRV